MGAHTQDHCPPALIAPGPSNRKLGTTPMPLNPLKLLKLANPKPVHPALSVVSTETTMKALAHSSQLHLPPDRPGALQCGLLWLLCFLLLASVSNKLSFQGQSSPDLLALSSLNNNKAYILKHSSNSNISGCHTTLFSSVQTGASCSGDLCNKRQNIFSNTPTRIPVKNVSRKSGKHQYNLWRWSKRILFCQEGMFPD